MEPIKITKGAIQKAVGALTEKEDLLKGCGIEKVTLLNMYPGAENKDGDYDFVAKMTNGLLISGATGFDVAAARTVRVVFGHIGDEKEIKKFFTGEIYDYGLDQLD